MLSLKITLSSLTTLMFLSTPLKAEEPVEATPEATIEGHVSVRSREIDPSKREQMQKSRAKERGTEETTDAPVSQTSLRRASRKLISADQEFMLAPATLSPAKVALASYAFPINCHWLMGVADTGRSIELEDGSHWEVSPTDAYILRGWRRDDSVVITPNYSWFSSYDYYITNKSTTTFVKANLYVGPLNFGPYSHWVVDIDYLNGHIFLENQMIWCVNPQDGYVLKDWAVNDHVIFGIYESWLSPFDHILINVNMDDHLRVRQY